ncbi:MAG: hypothetical protein HDS56_04185 [Barnesiella sp.]|nr:hypothetical protein [Barnesiella sp.]MBD5344754.1 hypothetical protein [Bacteroides sp.]
MKHQFLMLIAAICLSGGKVHAQTSETVNPGHAFQVSAFAGANSQTSKDFGVEGVWKKNIHTNLFINCGLSLGMDYTNTVNKYSNKRNMLEVGVPVQLEWSKLSFGKSSFYGLVGFSPVFYSTLSARAWSASSNTMIKDAKKSGCVISPTIEAGGNIPLQNTLIRIGVFYKSKINCTPDGYNVYRHVGGLNFIGLKAGVIF